MKIFISCSRMFFNKVLPIKEELERFGHIVSFPNGYNTPNLEEEMKLLKESEYREWKSKMLKEDGELIKNNDAILVLNFEKNGIPNYIGEATFLEMFRSLDSNKKIFLYNPIPNNMLKDEIEGMNPIVISGNLSLVQ